jgi:YHS domain-containing protein
MEAVRPAKLIDPVCGMTVDVAAAEAGGLLLEYEGRTFAFCRSGCRRAFVEEPATYVAKAEAAEGGAGVEAHGGADHGAADHHALPVIDEGMRRWYESCACCLSDAFPEIKAQLDAERAAAALGPVDPGICEGAEAMP